MKTGECYFLDDEDNLWLAESYQDDAGEVTTRFIFMEKKY